MLLVCCSFVPIAACYLWVKEFLIAIGVEEETAQHAKTYGLLMLPSLLLKGLADAIDIFLIAMGMNDMVFFVMIFVVPTHLLAVQLLVGIF